MGPYSCMGLTCKEKPHKADMGAALGLNSRGGSRKLPGGGEEEIGTTKPSLSAMGGFLAAAVGVGGCAHVHR